ncbi:MAG TPA: SufD family Fe-S cluster assembly protein [Gammaproteobacteria bacterium]|nr:SufD family Fe-S cluster assembly protein [Gammaproteobacteria bacterium]
MSALNDMLEVLGTVYDDAAIVASPQIAHLIVDGNNLLSLQQAPGVSIASRLVETVLEAEIVVAQGVRLEQPIHLCIGMLGPRGLQHIRSRIKVEEDAQVSLLAHCLFPVAESSRHVMEAEVELAAGAQMNYREGHYHGPTAGIEVLPKAVVKVGPGGRFFSDFFLTTGRAGRLHLDYRIEAAAESVTEVTTRIFGHGSDEIRTREELVLAGRAARGLLKSRVAVDGEASSEVISITHGNAAEVRGHMDCVEIILERARAQAQPIVSVSHPLAKVTHEAAVGTVDQKQLETLMARGLSPEAAVDVLITGMLR